ncbi:MAG TPA: prepilin-type N-terminal cleavage/methylation domain-containing protein [Thermoanaerobaculia bacterium]|nr:prepilin-type N-terminal cleavage/methylation domain-containing protein [Thermoanaerobaculia bacterium]
MRTKRSSSAGFSLAEVLVAVALLSVILLALFGLVTAGVRQAYSGKKMTQASMVAQSAIERMNIQQCQDLLGAASTDTSVNRTWTKTDPGSADAKTTPAAETGTTAPILARNAVRDLLRTSDLAATPSAPATLTVTMNAMPSTPTPTNFGNCSMVNVVVDLNWFDYGLRKRTIRLQSLNLRVVP